MHALVVVTPYMDVVVKPETEAALLQKCGGAFKRDRRTKSYKTLRRFELEVQEMAKRAFERGTVMEPI